MILGQLEGALALWRGGLLADIPELGAYPLVTAIAEERIAAMLPADATPPGR
jgi:hypothetical protein